MSLKKNESRRNFFKATAAMLTVAVGVAAWGNAALAQDSGDETLSLAGKRIGISAVGTDHHWDLMAYQGIIDEVKALGGEPIALDAKRNDQTHVSQLQTLIAQKPDAIVEMLGNLDVLNPWLKRIRDNYALASEVALQMVADMGGKGNVLVFNGFYGVPVCKVRYDQLKYVLQSYPDVKIIEPELRDVIPNTVQSAYSNVTDMLTKYPKDGDISAVWACWDIPQIGATQAIEAAGRKGIKTYAIDGSPEVVEMVANPDSAAGAVGAQQPYEIGRSAARNAARYLAGEHVPPFTFVPAVLVTKENAKDKAGPFLPKKKDDAAK
jgi:ribose transport system substrate-binding protein